MHLTIISTPRPFHNEYKTIQENAISSWINIRGEKEIILFDKSSFDDESMKYYHNVFIDDIRKNKFGTPLISSMIEEGQKIGNGDLFCFINCDIILPVNFIEVIKSCNDKYEKFLMVGHRHDLELNKPIDFSKKNEVEAFWEYAKTNGEKHGPWGIDYFVFNKGVYNSIPDFAIGRFMYDNWLIWNARRNRIPVIDASNDIMVVHQNHDYNTKNFSGEMSVRKSDEAKENKRLFGDAWNFGIQASTLKIIDGKVLEKASSEEKKWYLFRLRKVYPEYSFFMKIYYKITRLFFKKY